MPDESWMKEGLCNTLHLTHHLFFPEQGRQPFLTSRAAKQACNACPVQDTCLQYAMDNNIPYGIWGGKSREERKKLRRLRIMWSNPLTVDSLEALPENLGHG